jgi:hypothetical protein
MATNPIHVNADTFQVQLDTLASTMVERIKDEWPMALQHLNFAQGSVVMNVRYSRDVFRAIRSIFADEKTKDVRWNWNELLLMPAVNRTLIDTLFNQIFLSEDIENRSIWFHQSGWKEQKLELDRMKAQYGNNPQWTQKLLEYQSLVDKGMTLFKISPDQIADPKKIISWPSSGQMPNYGIDPTTRNADRQFLQYLTDWFYKDHSTRSHMSFLGQMKMSPLIFREDLPKDERLEIEKKKFPLLLGEQLSRSAFLLLCLLSEIQNQFKFSGNLELRILEIWHALIPGFPEVKEIFDLRYAAMFPAPLIII